MTKKQTIQSNTFELPFLIYIAIVDNGQTLSEDEVENFVQEISASNWCKSTILQTILKKANDEYSQLWKKYLSGNFIYPLKTLETIYENILLDLSKPEREILRNDLLHLVECFFNASDNLFLASPKSKIKMHELIKSILLETSVKTDSAKNQDSTKVEQEPSASGKKTAMAKVSQPVSQLWPLAAINTDNTVSWKRGKIDLRCIQIIDETHDVKTFRFISNEHGLLFFFKPGQFIGLELTIAGNKIMRSYTISSTPSRPHNLSITVKRVPGGQVSNWLHDNLKVGDIISANGPNGKFNCFDYPAKKMLLISGGSGITPVMSMMRWIADTGSNADIVFLHNARTPHDIIYAKELDLLSSMYNNIKIVISVSSKAYDGWQGFTGRISPQMIEMIAPDFIERNIYVCGPEEYMDATYDILQGMNFPMENYYSESFGVTPKKGKVKNKSLYNNTNHSSAEQYIAQDPSMSNTNVENTQTSSLVIKENKIEVSNNDDVIFFQKSSMQVVHDSSKFILDIAEDENIEIPSSCRYGCCGTCKVLKIEGEVVMEATADILSYEEINKGYILACCSIPKGKVVIDA